MSFLSVLVRVGGHHEVFIVLREFHDEILDVELDAVLARLTHSHEEDVAFFGNATAHLHVLLTHGTNELDDPRGSLPFIRATRKRISMISSSVEFWKSWCQASCRERQSTNRLSGVASPPRLFGTR